MTVGADMLWTKMINPELAELGEGFIVLKKTPEELHLNHNGDMHAGVIFSMTEMAGMGVVVMLLGDLAKDAFVVVKNVNIDFISRAQGEISFKATMGKVQCERVIGKAKSAEKVEEQVDIEATDANGKLVSSSTVTAVIMPKR